MPVLISPGFPPNRLMPGNQQINAQQSLVSPQFGTRHHLREVYHLGYIAPHSRELGAFPKENIPDACVHINCYPAFIKAPLTTAISTHFLYQCAALIIINKRENWHYMAHINETTNHQDIAQHFQDQKIDFKNCEVYILPGRREETRNVVREIQAALRWRLSPWKKIQYIHFPLNRNLVASYHGEIYCDKAYDYYDYARTNRGLTMAGEAITDEKLKSIRDWDDVCSYYQSCGHWRL